MAETVAILRRALDGGGMQRNTVRLAAALRACDHAVDVLVAEPKGPMRTAVAAAARLVPLARGGHLRSRLRARAAEFGVEGAVARYSELLLPEGSHGPG